MDGVADGIQSPLGPLVVVFLLSYLMAAIFMSVYAITSLTLLQCLYADVDLCKQYGADVYEAKQRPKEMAYIVKILRKD